MTRRDRSDVWEQWLHDNDKAICMVCNERLMLKNDSRTWHVEHIIRAAYGGPDTMINLAPICATCNLKMHKDCKCTFQYMERIGTMSIANAVQMYRRQLVLNATYDPICNQITRSGARCHYLKFGKDQEWCRKHHKINTGPRPMDISKM